MIYLLLELLGFSRKAAAEPLDKRRRMAALALAASVPVILALWGLSLRYSAAGFRSAGEAAKLPLEESKEALVVLQRGFANLRMISGTLWEGAQNRFAAQRDEKSPDAAATDEELYYLPIVIQ